VRSISLFWRVFAMNATVFIVGVVILAVSPATVSSPLTPAEAIVLVGGLAALLGTNLVLLRVSFAPLERVTRMMKRVDLLRPGERLPLSGSSEVAELIKSFNDMLDRLESERRVAARRVLAGQEAERRRIAQELHDEIGQSLTAVLLQLKQALEGDPDEVRERIEDAQEAARSSLDEVRRIAQRLRPGVLDDLGLVSALTAYAANFERRTAIRVTRSFEPSLPSLSKEAELAVYRIAQESLTNAARHAEATEVELTLERSPAGVLLRIADDGKGLNGVRPDGGGVRGMRERAILVGADFSLRARQGGSGVEVTLDVPAALEQPAEAEA
jgi:two-component system, NarL family, sensor histidine kinase UhpB